MKKALLMLLVVVLMVSFAQAADEVHPRTSKGDKALLFSINGIGNFGVGGNQAGFSPIAVYMMAMGAVGSNNSTDLPDLSNLTMPYSTGLGFLYYFGENTALRMGLSFASVKGTEEYTKKVDGYNGTSTIGLTMMSVAPGIQYHFVTNSRMTLYTGAELFYAKNSFKLTSKTDASDTETTVSFNGLGFAGLLGFQFYPWKNVSLGAEYKLGYASFSESTEAKSDSDSESQDGPGITMLGISTWGVTLGIHW